MKSPDQVGHAVCKQCGAMRVQDERYVDFAVGSSPVRTLSIKVRAQWCPRTGCGGTLVTVVPPPEERIEPRCKCGGEAADEPHPCPFRQEVNDDSETLCHCCTDCRQDCREDI